MPTYRFAPGPFPGVALVLLLSACTRLSETPEYQAACHGPPLAGLQGRVDAETEGYQVDEKYNCITKASYAAVERERAAYEAWNAPEAVAQREAEHERLVAEERARRAAEAQAAAAAAETETFVLRPVDVNRASESEIAAVPSLDAEIAAQIVAERAKGRFADWADLVRRVVGMSAAITVARASTSGLTVDGHSFPGAPPDPALAAGIKAYFDSRR